MNKEQPKLYGLDHLRALAILLVWFFHYQGSTFNDLFYGASHSCPQCNRPYNTNGTSKALVELDEYLLEVIYLLDAFLKFLVLLSCSFLKISTYTGGTLRM